MGIGDKIRKIRDLKGVKQQLLAEKVGVSQQHLSDIERNEVNITLDMLQRIATVLEIDSSQILDFNEELIFNSYHEQGGNANIYIVQEYSERLAKNYELTIETLRSENQFLKEQMIELLNIIKNKPL